MLKRLKHFTPFISNGCSNLRYFIGNVHSLFVSLIKNASDTPSIKPKNKNNNKDIVVTSFNAIVILLVRNDSFAFMRFICSGSFLIVSKMKSAVLNVYCLLKFFLAREKDSNWRKEYRMRILATSVPQFTYANVIYGQQMHWNVYVELLKLTLQ